MDNNKQCSLPWFEMDIYAQQTVRCCCYYKGDVAVWRDASSFDLESIWNHEGFQRLRSICGSCRLAGTGCSDCYGLKNFWSFISSFLTVREGLTSIQRDNWLKAIEHYERKDVIIGSYPVRYYLGVGFKCNLRCIMCGQGNARKTERRELPVDLLLSLRPYLQRAYDITLCGGEPLFIEGARRLIDTIVSDPQLSSVRLSLLTNGTLLHKYIDKFTSMRAVHVCVSLDSIGPDYEYIRKGAKWDLVASNMIHFKETSSRLGLAWTISAASLIMKSTVPRLLELVDWLISTDIPVHFQALDEGSPREEDIFRNPALLGSLPGWQDIFDGAVDRLKTRGWDDAAKTLISMKRELTENLSVYQAHTALESGDVPAAYKEAVRILQSDPHSCAGNLLLARVRLSEGDHSVAEKIVQDVLAAYPDNREAMDFAHVIKIARLDESISELLKKTDVLIAKKEYLLAVRVLKEVLKYYPRHQGALQRLKGIVRYVNKKVAEVTDVS